MPPFAPGAVRAAVTSALAAVPILLVTVALLPAIAVLPLMPGGQQRVVSLIRHLQAWTGTVLRES